MKICQYKGDYTGIAFSPSCILALNKGRSWNVPWVCQTAAPLHPSEVLAAILAPFLIHPPICGLTRYWDLLVSVALANPVIYRTTKEALPEAEPGWQWSCFLVTLPHVFEQNFAVRCPQALWLHLRGSGHWMVFSAWCPLIPPPWESSLSTDDLDSCPCFIFCCCKKHLVFI